MLFISFDLETTGLSTRNDKITQIGGTAFAFCEDSMKYKEISNIETFVKCDREISTGSVEKTGITKKHLISAPVIADALKLFFTWIGNTRRHVKKAAKEEAAEGAVQHKEGEKEEKEEGDKEEVILIAYNGIHFDFPILCAEITRCKQLPYLVLNGCGISTVLDPYQWAQAYMDQTCLIRNVTGKRSFKLSDVHQSLTGSPIIDAHQALADTKGLMTICCHEKFQSMFKMDEKTDCSHFRMSLKAYVHLFRTNCQKSESSSKKGNKNRTRTIAQMMKRFQQRDDDNSKDADDASNKKQKT